MEESEEKVLQKREGRYGRRRKRMMGREQEDTDSVERGLERGRKKARRRVENKTFPQV